MSKRLLHTIEWIGFLLLALGVAVVWLAGREETLQWAARKLVESSGGAIELEDVRGSLYGAVSIGRFRYEDADVRVVAETVGIDWESWALLVRPHAVRVTAVSVGKLDITSKSTNNEPPKLPESLRLPLPVRLDEVSIGELAFTSGDTHIDARRLRFAYEADAGSHRIALEHADSDFGVLQGNVAAGMDAPFPVVASLSANGRFEEFPFRLSATIRGPLDKLEVTAANSEPPLTAEAHAIVTPFAAVPVHEATVRAESLDPRAFDRTLPAADLKLDLVLRPLADGRYAGDFRIANRNAGPLDKDRIPVTEASANFEGEPEDLTLADVAIGLGVGGRLTGSGGFTRGHLHFDLRTTGLDLRALQSTLRQTSLAGTLQLKLQEDAQTLVADLAQQGYRIEAEAVHEKQRVEVRSARIRARGGEVDLKGHVALVGSRDFFAEGTVSRFDPSAFGDYPSGLLNGRFEATGSLAPTWRAAVTAVLADSRFRGAPLSGGGRFDVSGNRVANADIALRLGANRTNAQGSFGNEGDRLTWNVDLPEPKVIHPDLSGALKAGGVLEGTPAAPSGRFDIEGKDLRWGGDYFVRELKGTGAASRGLDGDISMSLSALDLKRGTHHADRVNVNVAGTLRNHEIALDAARPQLEASLRLAGGWFGKDGWMGRIVKLESNGDPPVQLQAPASIEFSPDRFVLGAAVLRVGAGTVKVQGVRRVGGALDTSGEVTGIPAAYLQKFGDGGKAVETTLTLGGRWDIHAAQRLNGVVEIGREQGDVVLQTDPVTALGLTQLTLTARSVDDQLQIIVQAAGKEVGTIAGEAATVVTRRGDGWALVGTAPLKLNAKAAMPSIAWLEVFAGDAVSVDGRLDVAVTADGTVATPNLHGAITGDGIQFGLPEHGVYLTRGTLRGTFEEDRIVLDELLLHGGDGTLTASGVYDLGKRGGLKLALVASKLELLSRPGQKLTVSGNLDGAVVDGQLKAKGALTADSARIEVLPTVGPTLSSDIVIKGQETRAERERGRNFAELDLELDLGKQFHVNAFGLEGRLEGTVTLRARDRELPTATGSIRVVQGYYTALGQRLTVDRGILTFSGPIDNPGINVLALRKNQAVEAGVSVTGTARAPVVKLVSVPDVPDTEKLSWLMLGRAPDPNARDNEALQAAAASLIAEGGTSLLGLQGATKGIGLDAVGLRNAGGDAGQVVSFGKRISDQVYLTYERSVSGALNLTKVRYFLSPRWSIEAATGTDNALDVFFTLFFD